MKKLHQLQGLDDKQFHNEFRNLIKVSHKNGVRLNGYCYETRHKYIQHEGEFVLSKEMERALCFEYMPSGSLDKHIAGMYITKQTIQQFHMSNKYALCFLAIADESCGLDWPTCYEIIKGTCEGLNHLHTKQEKPIFHLDLKPSNILLDKNMRPQISDLGLSVLVSSTETHKTEILFFF